MLSVITEIRQWANTLSYWEQAALDKVLAGVQFSESDYDELLQYLLEDMGLEKPTSQRPKLQFSDAVSNMLQPAAGKVELKKIFNLQNINALMPGQTLVFGPKLTAIFGATGSGKSGYARVLGCAGFTRGDKKVLPDVTQPWSDDIVLSADIEISDGPSTEVIHYQIGSQCPKLAPCYVFDSTSVYVHLTGSNTFSFSPAGLSCLTRLAYVTDKVRERLETRISEFTQPHDFGSIFQGKSVVTDFIDKLGPETSLEELRQMAALTPEEKEQISKLDIEIARLKTKDISKQIDKLTQEMEDLDNLRQRLIETEEKLGDNVMSDVAKAAQVYLETESLAKRISVDQFKSEHFTQIGSDVWHHFIEVAKALAEAEQTTDKLYPQVDDYCLLCQQPLCLEARNLLLRLWEYLESEAQAKLDESQGVLKEKNAAMNAIDLSFFNDQSVSYRYLEEHNMGLLGHMTMFIEACRQRRKLALKLIKAHTEETIAQLPDSRINKVEETIETLKAQRIDLEKQDPAQKITELGQEMLKLQHREILSHHLPQIETYLQKRVWAQQAARIGGDTRHITQKYKKLFRQLVTDRYIELFESTLRNLQHPLSVKVKTVGRKGKTCRQIVVETDPTAPIDEATPDKVLSEGEKRAVALADFLTEVTLDTTSSTVILDDPVTSLDLEWKEKIASILAAEAKNRQVIVFTHDLAFLYFLKNYAEQNLVEIRTHWIQRVDDEPGYVSLDNSPALEREYRKATRAHEFYRQAKNTVGEEQENFIRLGFGALRTSYEAFIIYDLFEEVVMRFDPRVSFGRLQSIKWDESIANKVNAKCELLSRYIEGHLPSNGYIEKPDPQVLLREIETFEELRKELRKLKAK